MFFPKPSRRLLSALFFLDILFLSGALFALGASVLSPVLFLALPLMILKALTQGVFAAAIGALWLSVFLSAASLLRGEWTAEASAFVQISLALSFLLSFMFHRFSNALKASEEKGDPSSSKREGGRLPKKPDLKWALKLAQKLEPVLRGLQAKQDVQKLWRVFLFLKQFIMYAEFSPKNNWTKISDFNACIMGFAEKLREGADWPPNLSLRWSLKGRGAIQGSIPLLEELFSHLMINAFQAVHATGGGKGEILVSTYNKRYDFILEIRDSGSGIENEDLARVFEPFFSRRLRFAGGLGLRRRRSNRRGAWRSVRAFQPAPARGRRPALPSACGRKNALRKKHPKRAKRSSALSLSGGVFRILQAD